MSVHDASAAGLAALNQRDGKTAKAFFERATGAGSTAPADWYGLSLAHRLLGNAAEENAALDRTLGLDANHLPALIAKGDLRARLGDRRGSSGFYKAALKLAATLPALPPEWPPELRRVESVLRAQVAAFEHHLVTALGAEGLNTAGAERFGRAIDLLLGKREIFHQQPKYFFFPELPEVEFFERHQFDWVEALERQVDGIREEARAVLDSGAGIVPYIQRDAARPPRDAFGLEDDSSWGAFFLIKDGVPVAENVARCPRTWSALAGVPLCRIEARTPSVLFSVLRPGTRIPPHYGFMNARLICHLPLIVPPGCGLRVGNERREWTEGRVTVFDDTIQHEAWNSGSETRVVLIFDIWRPELTDKERGLVSAMLTAIDRFDGSSRKW